jgi:predicted nucleotidyltransferase
MKPLADRHIQTLAYGSIARGDVNPTSDIDIYTPSPPAPALLQTLIESAGIHPTHREIIQATPAYAAKGYIHIDDNRSYSFPLVPLNTRETEFYGFAGSITPEQIQNKTRVPGVDKRLTLIQPTPTGHTETPIQGMEGTVAKALGIGTAAVHDRVRTLLRRQKIGRTGVYIKHTLTPEESFGEAHRRLAQSRPALRRRMRT